MSDHLPECPFDQALAKYSERTERQQAIIADLLIKFDVCICERLRACEQRMRAFYVNENCVWGQGECIPLCPTCRELDLLFAEWSRGHDLGYAEALIAAKQEIKAAIDADPIDFVLDPENVVYNAITSLQNPQE